MTAQILLTVDQFCSAAGVGRTLVYSLIKDKQIKVIKLGRRTPRWPQGKMTRIPASELALFFGDLDV